MVSVTSTGLVTSLGPAGTTLVRVASGALETGVTVRVNQTPTSLRTRDPVAILAGTSRRLTVTVLDAVDDPIADAQVTYSSTAPQLSVTPDGLVTARETTGTFEVRVQVGTLQSQIHVVVPTHPNGVIAVTEPVSQSPWGVVVSSRDLAYITLPSTGAPALRRMTLPGGSITTGPTGAVGGLPLAVAFSADGRFAYVPALSPGELSIIDAETNLVIASVEGLSGALYGLVVSNDDRLVYVTADNDLMHVIDVAARQRVTSVNLQAVSNQLIVHPTQPRILASSYNGAKVLEIDAVSPKVLRTFAIGGQPQGLAVSPDGDELYVADELGRLVVWNLTTNSLIQEISVPAGAFGLALTPDATQIYLGISGGVNGVVQVYDRVSRALVNTLVTGGSPRRIAFDVSGRTAIVTNDANVVHIVQ